MSKPFHTVSHLETQVTQLVCHTLAVFITLYLNGEIRASIK